MLRNALRDYEAGAMTGIDPAERAAIVESIKQRIADIDAKIRQLDDA